MTAQLGFIILAIGLIVAATTALCLGHLSSSQWIAIVGPAGVLGGAGHYLVSGSS
jgi:hypothetical protein